MAATAGEAMERCQTFGGKPDPRFKIDRHGSYADAVTGNRITVANGPVTLPVKGNSAGIYVLNGPGKIGRDGVFLR